MNWSFEHSIFTHLNRKAAWAFWADMQNHTRMEPGVERIELDGPFETGTMGRTIGTGYEQKWTLTDVVTEQNFTITGFTPDGAGSLSFAWMFADEGFGTRMTHRISAYGPQVEANMDEFRMMEIHAPKAMARLAAELDQRAQYANGNGP